MKLADPCGCFPTGRHYPGIAHLIQVRAVGVAEEFDAGDAWVDLPVAFLDTETTGTDPKVNRIIEVGIVIGRGAEVVERRNWLINPGVPIPPESTEVHQITDEMVADKPSFGEVVGEILAVLAGKVPAAYNASFDRAFLRNEVERCGALGNNLGGDLPPAVRSDVTWIDPLVFAREFYKGQGESRALGAVAERLGISLDNAHRATDDAEAALEVLYAFSRDSRMPDTYAALVQEQRRLGRLQQEAQRFWRK
ncbi:MAG: 3'-5' exonuclease [Myxococcales bacterium]|nr:3'-5' exonuclease [Myxococcales bacterium]